MLFADYFATFLGYFYDDLIPDESAFVQEALQRLTPEQRMQRLYRIRRGLNLSLKKISLPKEEWTKPHEVLLERAGLMFAFSSNSPILTRTWPILLPSSSNWKLNR